MSYASVASHNIPFGEMPKPDPNLADGHFEGETHAHALTDEKINVLPAGSDLEHPPIEQEKSPRPEPITLHHASDPNAESHALNVAPEPAPVPIDPKRWDQAEKAANEAGQKAQEAGQEVKETAKDAEKKGKEVARDAEKKGKEVARDAEKKAKDLANQAEKKGKELGRKAKAELEEVESKLGPYWEKTKDVVLRPSTLGGLVGVMNVGLLGTLGYFAYTRRNQPWDQRVVAGAVAGTLGLFTAEGYVADSYLNTEEGRAEAERAKREGSKFYLEAKERILRPGVFGGLAGALNLAVLGTVGYLSYQNWNRPWDRRVVSGVAIGLITLSGLEGYAGKKYVDEELPKRR